VGEREKKKEKRLKKKKGPGKKGSWKKKVERKGGIIKNSSQNRLSAEPL